MNPLPIEAPDATGSNRQEFFSTHEDVERTRLPRETSSLRASLERPLDATWVIRAAAVLATAVFLSGATGDPDMWGHIRFGLDLLERGALPTVDPHSFTQDRPIVYHEWLTALVMALSYKNAGVTGLLLLKLAVTGATFVIIWLAWRHVNPLATLFFLPLAALGAGPVVRTTRPHIWTLLALVILVWILQKPLNLRRAGAILVLFTIWANMHGGFLVGLGVLGVWCAIEVLLRWLDTGTIHRGYLALPVGAALATIGTPYGVDLWVFLYETVRPHRDIVEWQPLWTKEAALWLPPVMLIAVMGFRRLWPAAPALAAMFLLWYGGTTVARIAYLAIPVTVLLIAPVAARRWPATQFHWRMPAGAIAFMVVPLLAAALAIVPVAARPFRCLSIGEQDPEGVARLAASTVSGRVANFFSWGQYGLWHLSPKIKVSWDGRRETHFSEAVLRTQGAVTFGLPEGDEWLARVGPEYVWLPARFSTRRQWLLSNGYRLDHDTATSFIAVRDDLPKLPAAAALPRCFE